MLTTKIRKTISNNETKLKIDVVKKKCAYFKKTSLSTPQTK